MASLFSDFLTALRVKHTEAYSDKRFAEMPFASMYGLSVLLREYGVASAGVTIPAERKEESLPKLPIPFLADTPDGFAIITDISGGTATYLSQHRRFSASVEEVAAGWNGIALLASPRAGAGEPEYGKHRISEVADAVKTKLLAVLWAAIVVYAMFASGLSGHWAAWLLLALDCIGLFFSWMLVQKSLGFNTRAAEAVCSVLDEGGCDVIARSEASSFMGIFKWSEVGLAYFSVSLAAMLLVPQSLPALALINILCLPYTIWSIWYQKFKAKAWCTLCVSVQCTLWLLFGSYLIGGYVGLIAPTPGLIANAVVLGCCYAAVMLGLNRIDSIILKYTTPDQDGSEKP